MITAELNQLLKKKRILTAAKLTELEKDWSTVKTPTPWEDFLIDKKALTEADLLKVKSEEFNVPIVDLHDQEIPEAVLNLVPEPIARRHKVISFAKGKADISLAMMDPTDLQTKEFIKKKAF
jgi:type IV pilus assembly protein PilB